MKRKAAMIANSMDTVSFTIMDIIIIAREFGFDEEGNLIRALKATLQTTEKAVKTINQIVHE